MTDFDDRVDARATALLDGCTTRGIQPSGDLRVTVPEAALLLRVSVRTIQRAVEDGALEITRLGRRVSCSLTALARYVELGTGKDAVPPPKRRRTRKTTHDDPRRPHAAVKTSKCAHAENSKTRGAFA